MADSDLQNTIDILRGDIARLTNQLKESEDEAFTAQNECSRLKDQIRKQNDADELSRRLRQLKYNARVTFGGPYSEDFPWGVHPHPRVGYYEPSLLEALRAAGVGDGEEDSND